MPPTTATPIGRRLSAPAPKPIALGRMPAIVENAVGQIFVGAAFPYTWWFPGIGIAAVAMAAAGAASSIVPAYEAADMPVREALARG